MCNLVVVCSARAVEVHASEGGTSELLETVLSAGTTPQPAVNEGHTLQSPSLSVEKRREKRREDRKEDKKERR